MKFTLIGFLVILTCMTAFAIPAKESKSNKKSTTTPSPCAKPCDDKYEPLCAQPAEGTTGKDLSFGSQCVLDRYNCEHKSAQYIKKADDECPDGGSIRLQ